MFLLRGLGCCCDSDGQTPAEVEITDRALPALSASALPPGETSLWEAVAGGDSREVSRLLALRADVNQENPESTPQSRRETPLIAATRAGHFDVLEALLDSPSIDVNATTDNEVQTNRSKQTALHWAAREGASDIVGLLLTHPHTDVNLQTAMGYPPLFVAAQQGCAEVVDLLVHDKRTDVHYVWTPPGSALEADVIKVAIFDGRTEVVQVLLGSGRFDAAKINAVTQGPDSKSPVITDAAMLGHASIVSVLLDHAADPSVANSKGLTTLEVAVNADSTEIVMLLLSSGLVGKNKFFSDFRQAQYLGDAAQIRSIFREDANSIEAEQFPKLHQAVFVNSEEELAKEIARSAADGVAAADVVDGGGFPAVFWAIELGHWALVRKLLISSHGMTAEFVDKLLSGGFGAVDRSPSTFPGERTFDVFRALLADDAKLVTDNKHKATGAFALIKPFCASVAALRYFKKYQANYWWLREACDRSSHRIYEIIDQEVGIKVLQDLALVAEEENLLSLRQDDPGLVPELKYYRDESMKQCIVGNEELYVSRSLALLALAINPIFMTDMRSILAPFKTTGVKISEAPPKAFSRMYNKLMNRDEHGDPSIPKPRPMKNVDLNRLGVSVTAAEDVERVFHAFKSKYKILRVKNSHRPDQEGHGAYRSLLVNFAYDTGLTWRQLMGTSSPYEPVRDSFVPGDATSRTWFEYCSALSPAWEWSWGMEGLWRAARKNPDRRVVLSAEVQIILEPYMRGRLLSHLLYKISRCQTGPAEMARDFAGSYQEETDVIRQARSALLQMVTDVRANARSSADSRNR